MRGVWSWLLSLFCITILNKKKSMWNINFQSHLTNNGVFVILKILPTSFGRFVRKNFPRKCAQWVMKITSLVGALDVAYNHHPHILSSRKKYEKWLATWKEGICSRVKISNLSCTSLLTRTTQLELNMHRFLYLKIIGEIVSWHCYIICILWTAFHWLRNILIGKFYTC